MWPTIVTLDTKYDVSEVLIQYEADVELGPGLITSTDTGITFDIEGFLRLMTEVETEIVSL